MPNMPAEKAVSERKLRYQEFISRETGKRHHTHSEDMYQYELLRAGDPRAMAEAKRMWAKNLPGHVSDDPVRNYKYLFVASITLASRAAIAGGMEDERAYNSSDLFILRMDTLKTVEEVLALHNEMFTFYTNEMAALDKKNVFSRPVCQCLDYIYEHLHEPIRVPQLAALVGLNGSYLSTLFKKEVGCGVSAYVMNKRIEAAQNMLRYTDESCAAIAALLGFSSQSHFIRAFRQHTGATPRAFRSAAP